MAKRGCPVGCGLLHSMSRRHPLMSTRASPRRTALSVGFMNSLAPRDERRRRPGYQEEPRKPPSSCPQDRRSKQTDLRIGAHERRLPHECLGCAHERRSRTLSSDRHLFGCLPLTWPEGTSAVLGFIASPSRSQWLGTSRLISVSPILTRLCLRSTSCTAGRGAGSFRARTSLRLQAKER